MTRKLAEKFKDERANALVENVIILPLVFIIIFALIIISFFIHDRTTLESAAKRGTIYAAHCICDPNYATILETSGNQGGSLDIAEQVVSFSFIKVGKNIKPYRYISTSGTNGDNVREEVRKIIEETHIPWREISIDSIDFKQNNKMYYQDVTVTINADYPLPKFFNIIGLSESNGYTVTAKMTVNDPDEFLRNADMVVDTIAKYSDTAFGQAIAKATETISSLASKITEFFDK